MTSPHDPHTKSFSHINGSAELLLDRLTVAELCKGWPVYRDASEWRNFRSIFAPRATVWTTWSGARSVDDFIAISKAGKEAGVFIMHRECGTLVELAGRRAVGKMKATITQRFREVDGLEYDVDCDCSFIFFCEKSVLATTSAAGGKEAQQPTKDSGALEKEEEAGAIAGGASSGWKAHYVKLFYCKDKIVPADGCSGPRLTSKELMEMEKMPEGYKYLGTMQKRLGYTIDQSLPTPRNDGWGKMYAAMEAWLDGAETVDL